MGYYERLKRKRLGDILVDEGASSREAVITALHEHQQSNILLSEVLLSGQELAEYDLARAMVAQYQLPFIDLRHYTFHRDLIAEFPPQLLHDARMVPLDRFGGVVSFVCQELPSDEVFADLAAHGAEQLFLFAALASDIRVTLHEHVPLDEEGLAQEQAVASMGMAGEAGVEDSAWKDLFDTANEAIISDLGPGGEESAD